MHTPGINFLVLALESPLAFSRLTPSTSSLGEGFCQPCRKHLFRAMPVISREREVRDWKGFLTLW